MKIPSLNLRAQYDEIRTGIAPALSDVLERPPEEQERVVECVRRSLRG